MIKKARIPTLKSDSFRRSYFKHSVTLQPKDVSPDLYFEINHRCVWPAVIDAHRLEFYMIFIMTRGEGVYTFGPKEYYVRENTLCFVGPDLVRSWRAQVEDQQGFFVNFSETFFSHGYENKHLLHDLPFFQVDGHPVLSLTEKQLQNYLTLFQWMKEEHDNRTESSSAVLRSHLHLLLHKANAEFKKEQTLRHGGNGAGLRLVKAFKALYMRHFHVLGQGRSIMLKKVAEYADELGVSQNHLNDTIKLITGRSAGQLIRYHLANHATMCLMHADKSISEIAFALGFEDPSYFARFYKGQTGKSPSEFRSGENP
jgi:AraC family transcriptional regulator, transcriptional activator of pobA